MAAQDKSERPTPWRRRRAREKGQVAKSQDLGGAVSVMAAVVALAVMLPRLWLLGYAFLRSSLEQGSLDWSVATARAVYQTSLWWALSAMGPLLVVALVFALLANLAQVGFLFTSHPLRWNLARVSPAENLKRFVSVQGLVNALKSVLKMAVLLGIAGYVLYSHLPRIASLGGQPLTDFLREALVICFDLALKCGGALVGLGLLDYVQQRYFHERSLRMSRQELREELKQTEGDPLLRMRRQQRRREFLQGQITRELAQASVVVTNPTHIAVALRYGEDLPAPKVVAKGKGHLAERIVYYARRYGIPTYPDQPLARTLYRQVRVGGMIPPALYQAVAEVLAIILRRRREARRRRE